MRMHRRGRLDGPHRHGAGLLRNRDRGRDTARARAAGRARARARARDKGRARARARGEGRGKVGGSRHIDMEQAARQLECSSTGTSLL